VAFTFRLEKVLSVRRLQEEAAQQALAQAREELARASATLVSLEGDLLTAQEEVDALKRSDELTPEALYLHSLHGAGLRRKIDQARQVLARASDAAEAAAARVLEAHRAREALERLREREEVSWRKDQDRREARELDEIAVSRHRAREEENHGP
jgi:flagellar export protein FliJ